MEIQFWFEDKMYLAEVSTNDDDEVTKVWYCSDTYGNRVDHIGPGMLLEIQKSIVKG